MKRTTGFAVAAVLLAAVASPSFAGQGLLPTVGGNAGAVANATALNRNAVSGVQTTTDDQTGAVTRDATRVRTRNHSAAASEKTTTQPNGSTSVDTGASADKSAQGQAEVQVGR